MTVLKWTLVLLVREIVTIKGNSAQTLIDTGEYDSRDVFKELDDLRKQMDTLNQSNMMLSHKLSELGSMLLKSHANDPGPTDVYFTAQLNQDKRGIAIGEKIIYEHDFQNGGGGYNNSTGVFTAPTSGVYMFSFVCNSLKAQSTTLAIMKNGYLQANCNVEPAYDGENETGGGLVTLRLSIGDEVWVEAYYSDQTTIDLKKNLNSFAGVLIHR